MYFTSTTVKSVGHSMVVYHLHGQTGRFTVRANGKQKFKTEITCSIFQNTAVIKLVSKMTLKKWNTNF